MNKMSFENKYKLQTSSNKGFILGIRKFVLFSEKLEVIKLLG